MWRRLSQRSNRLYSFVIFLLLGYIIFTWLTINHHSFITNNNNINYSDELGPFLMHQKQNQQRRTTATNLAQGQQQFIHRINNNNNNNNNTALRLNSVETRQEQYNLFTSGNKKLHILFGLYGGKEGFLNEWEIALKSLLVNAPLDAPMHIHILVNDDAQKGVQERLQGNKLMSTQPTKRKRKRKQQKDQNITFHAPRFRNPVSITIYNVQAKEKEWTSFVEQKIRDRKLDDRVTFGGYFRLLAHQILPPDVDSVVYMDTDVVIMANLNDLLRHINETALYQFSINWPCSGFMILNIKRFDQFWKLVDQLESIENGNDQYLLVRVSEIFPHVVADLPSHWSIHFGHGFKLNPHKLHDRKQKASILHFNGAASFRQPGESYYERGFAEYCLQSYNCRQRPRRFMSVKRTWALAVYYIDLPWWWVFHQSQSLVRRHETPGHELRVEIKIIE